MFGIGRISHSVHQLSHYIVMNVQASSDFSRSWKRIILFQKFIHILISIRKITNKSDIYLFLAGPSLSVTMKDDCSLGLKSWTIASRYYDIDDVPSVISKNKWIKRDLIFTGNRAYNLGIGIWFSNPSAPWKEPLIELPFGKHFSFEDWFVFVQRTNLIPILSTLFWPKLCGQKAVQKFSFQPFDFPKRYLLMAKKMILNGSQFWEKATTAERTLLSIHSTILRFGRSFQVGFRNKYRNQVLGVIQDKSPFSLLSIVWFLCLCLLLTLRWE